MKTPWRSVNHIAKVVVAHLFYYTGVFRIWQAVAMRRKAIVLMYHRVLTASDHSRSATHPALVTRPETFALHMDLLEERFAVLSMETFAHRLRHNLPFPDSSCLITFDDGWIDNYTEALPILERHGFPALIFLPVNFIGTRRMFWLETLTHLLARAVTASRTSAPRKEQLTALLTQARLDHLLAIADDEPLPSIVLSTRRDRPSRADAERLIPLLGAALDIDLTELSQSDGFMDWEAVAAMRRQRISFGGHGAEHLLLTQVSPSEQMREIVESKRVLDERVNESVPTFSYPNGYYTPDITKTVEACGYQLAFTTARGHVQTGDNPFTIRRLNIHEAVTASKPMFLARVLGLF